MSGDPTEMARPQTNKTSYVGKLSDGQTGGYWLLLLATPYQRRVLPFRDLLFYDHWGISHVSKSLSFSSVRELKQPLRDNPLVLDHEFSYLELMQALVVEQLNFVIRLKVRATFLDQEVKSMVLSVKKGETRILNKVFYIGKVFVNLIGQWKEGLSTPLWVTSSLPQKQALALYLQGMKIDESFRDLKSLIGFDKMMRKKQHPMEQMVALVLMAYAIGLVLGETALAHLFPRPPRKYDIYSGLSVLLKLKWNSPYPKFNQIIS